MRQLLKFFFLIAIGFFLGSSFFQEFNISSQNTYLQYPSFHRPFVVVIVGKNNGAYVEKTIQSLLIQDYDRFRLIYVDDASTDGSEALAKEKLQELSIQVEYIQNETSLGNVLSLSKAISKCSSEEIVIPLRGEDWLAHEWVITRLNQYFSNPKLWVAFASEVNYPDFKIENGEIPNRKKTFKNHYFASFYAGIFNKISDEDLRLGFDLSYLFPLIEMADGHVKLIPEVLYVQNEWGHQEVPISPAFEKTFRLMASYQPLKKRE